MSIGANVLGMNVVRGMKGVGGVCMCLARGGVWGEGVDWILGFTNPVGTRGVLDVCLCCRGVCREWLGCLEHGMGRTGWCYVCVSLDSLCRWQVQLSVYCARRIPAHLRCNQCSVL